MRKAAFLVLALLTLHPAVSSAASLFAGIAFALLWGNPDRARTSRFTPLALQCSIVGLGAHMDLVVVGRVGSQGILYTAVGIGFALGLGWLLGRLLKTDPETSLLVGVGTAICGGSAIAAVAPAIRARDQSVSVALATVFILNASALLFFPALGHAFGLDERQFGLFSALAVHDTSSVVGTALQYGPEALTIATTVKLARALWIIPVTLAIGFFWNRRAQDKGAKKKPKRPWFILGFLIAAAIVSFIPETRPAGEFVAMIARRTLVLSLFLIGSGLTRETLKAVGPRPFAQGVLLWALVAGGTLLSIRAEWIR